MELSVDPSEMQPLGEYNFERNFNEREAREWIRENWHKSVFFAVAYLTLVFGIQHFMKKWRGYQLRIPLILWSFSLALFSSNNENHVLDLAFCFVYLGISFII